MPDLFGPYYRAPYPWGESDPNKFGLAEYLNKIYTDFLTDIKSPDETVRQDAQEIWDKVVKLYQSGVTDLSQYPSFVGYYSDWTKLNGNLISANIWEAKDGSQWKREVATGAKGQEVYLTPYSPPPESNTEELISWNNLARNLANDTAAWKKWEYEQQIAADETTYNRSQADYTRSQAEVNKHLAQIEADKDRAFSEKQLAMTGEQYAWQRANAAQQLQLERDKYGAELESQPKSWIEAWKFRNAPAIQQAQNTAQEWIRTTNELPDLQNRVAEQQQYFYNTYPGAQGTPVSDFAGSLSTTDPDFVLAARALQTWQNRYNQAQAMAGSGQPAMPATTPPAPEWLPAFVPGLQAGQPLTQQRARVASGQQWQATPWSQRQMLGGYLEYASPAGIPTLTDYEQMVESMLPKQAEKTPRWIPARQW